MRNFSDATLQFELEKAQKLLWMIEAEIRRRRTLELEEEVKKEMMIAREMAMRRANELGFLLEAPLALPQETCFTLLGLNAFTPSPRPAEINAAEMKQESDGSKKKLIILPRPNETRSEGKRKAEEKNGENAEFEFELEVKKKDKEVKVLGEWRCELCNVLTTSEKGFNDHLRGKKHTSKDKAQNRKMGSPNLLSRSVVCSCSNMDAKSEKEEKEDEDDEKKSDAMNSGVKKH